MKNYMANKTFSRGVETMPAEASMVFIGNTSGRCRRCSRTPTSSRCCLRHTTTPPTSTGCTAIYPAGKWRSSGVNYSPTVTDSSSTTSPKPYATYATTTTPTTTRRTSASEDISTRDRDGVRKTFSGLMKLIHPHRGATVEETENLLCFAIEGRKRVKDQILRIDRTMDAVKFGYTDSTGTWHDVTTQEELDFPHLYHRTESTGDDGHAPAETTGTPVPQPVEPELATGAVDIADNALGHSYANLLMPYLRGSEVIRSRTRTSAHPTNSATCTNFWSRSSVASLSNSPSRSWW